MPYQYIKELYWQALGPGATSFNYRRMQKKYAKKASDITFDNDWFNLRYNRMSAVNHIIASYNRHIKYLEIGCAGNACFNSIPVIDKIGVDPASGGTHRMTSDAFFEENTSPFDVVFVDGLHTFEQCRKDAKNSLEQLNVGGYVIFHDMLPRNWKEEHVPRLNLCWTGDVWKVAAELMQTKGIDFRILEIDNGVAVAKKVSDQVEYHDAYDELSNKTFNDYVKLRPTMPIYSFEESFEWLNNSFKN